MDRIICKNCGNNELTKMRFIEENRYIHCLICNSVTPLYTDYSIQEISGSVKMEGLRSFDEKLNNGYNLLKIGEFGRAENEFGSLKNDYSSDYRTWVGYSVASTCNFSVSDHISYMPHLLERVEKVLSGNPAGECIVSEAKEYYKTSNTLYEKLNGAKGTERDKQREMENLQSAKEPVDPEINEIEKLLASNERTLQDGRKENIKGISILVLFFILIIGGIILRSVSYASLDIIASYILVGIFALCFLCFIPRQLKNTLKRHRLKNAIQNYANEIEERKRRLTEATNQFRNTTSSKLSELSQEIEEIRREILLCEREIQKHKESFSALFDKWCGLMNLNF